MPVFSANSFRLLSPNTKGICTAIVLLGLHITFKENNVFLKDVVVRGCSETHQKHSRTIITITIITENLNSGFFKNDFCYIKFNEYGHPISWSQ